MSSNLRSRDAYRDAAWDWSVLNGCFGNGIKPSDIDGMVERHGHFLFLEAKPVGGSMSGGQRIALQGLSLKPLVSVVVFCGDHSTLPPLVTEITIIASGRPHSIGDAGLGLLRALVRHWYVCAEENSGSEVDWSRFTRPHQATPLVRV